ncbi:hypothetical protein HYDPIDRAFT_41834 [Hydnomerulius pinastri MD-312]|uniref:HRDC domain-containing protein n=1 Tax=Hydnomerulius pinastri MD-312 TaxID=994086 RepID=A0A0C9W6V2_9AGAM|nr:hypothetical protein HYDPIDRAFT_41834 [Hydnomerulius pinastri MD-312]
MATSSEAAPDKHAITPTTFPTYSDTLQAAALNTTRLAATSLPSDLSFHRSIHSNLAPDIDAFSARVLGLTNRLIRLAGGKISTIEEEEDVVDGFVRTIVDSMEGMLERTDSALDEYLGRKKGPAIPIPAVPVDPHQNTKVKKPQPPRGRLDPALTHASHLPKPQLKFKHTPSNTDESPYIPATLIPHKWCAKVPLGYIFHDERLLGEGEGSKDEEAEEEETKKRTIHPYYYELTHPSYPDHVFNPPPNPVHPSALDMSSPSSSSSTHPLTYVSSPKSLLDFANTISTATELAIDLEHHSYRSYRGFLALMQVSTRQEDYVIDLLMPELREGLRQGKGKKTAESEDERMAREAGETIARVFADPAVVKVFHGAESDIVWLQEDFNIFVVGLFDTFHASKVLEFPKHSLANLLETYCDFIPDKRYQLADWRIRPLPNEMLTYARSDTHFLLYIYDKLRLALIARASSLPPTTPPLSSAATANLPSSTNLISTVLSRSARTSLRLHDIEVYDADHGTGPGGWDTLARKWNKAGLFGVGGGRRTPASATGGDGGVQGAVYRAVHRWREDVAREEDESTRYVLPNHHLFLLSERTPSTVPELLSLFGGPGGGNGGVPPVLRRRAGELVGVVKGAIDAVQAGQSRKSTAMNAEGAPEDVEMVVASVNNESATSKGESELAVVSTNESRLWAVGASSSSIAFASRSSLFGASVEVAASSSVVGGSKAYAATRSVLFGEISGEPLPSSRTSKSTYSQTRTRNASTERFKDLVERIHRTLVIAPVVPTPAKTEVSITTSTSTSSTVPPASVPTPSEPTPAAQAEIPFVPAHQRQANPLTYAPLEDDTIVVVGQAGARQRKRKREKNKGTIGTGISGAAHSRSKSGTAEPGASIGDQEEEESKFDYSSVPNLLDGDGKIGGGEDVERRKKKQKQVKGSGLFEYGNFRAPPRDQREVKSGNKTHTFR